MVDNYTILMYILYSVLGALAYRLAWSKNSKDLVRYESLKHLLIGAIVGLIYYNLHSEYNFPNSIMSFVAGWMGTDFLESLIEQFRKLLRREEEST